MKEHDKNNKFNTIIGNNVLKLMLVKKSKVRCIQSLQVQIG
jgi:hypothetical protein